MSEEIDTGYELTYLNDIIRARDATIAEQASEIERLTKITAMTMGVGNGDGNLFVHGDYDSIKAAQAIVIANDSLRQQLASQSAEAKQREETLWEQLRQRDKEFAKQSAELAQAREKLEEASIIGLEKIEQVMNLTAQLSEAKQKLADAIRMRPTHGDITALQAKLTAAESEIASLQRAILLERDTILVRDPALQSTDAEVESKVQQSIELMRAASKCVELTKELDAAKADSERVDWLIKQGPPGATDGIGLSTESWEIATGFVTDEKEGDQIVVRAAIDAARSTQRTG